MISQQGYQEVSSLQKAVQNFRVEKFPEFSRFSTAVTAKIFISADHRGAETEFYLLSSVIGRALLFFQEN